MQRYYNQAYNPYTGLPMANASITVNLAGTATKATLYSDQGVTALVNPVAADFLGRYQFYVADGQYDIVINAPVAIAPNIAAAPTYTIPSVTLMTPNAQAGGSALTAAHGTAAPVAAAGAGAGTTPPAPVVAANSFDSSGSLTFGTGTTPAAGAMVTVTFNAPYATAPRNILLGLTTAGGAVTTGGLGLYVSAISTTAFTVSAAVAPSASQANTVYGLTWQVVP